MAPGFFEAKAGSKLARLDLQGPQRALRGMRDRAALLFGQAVRAGVAATPGLSLDLCDEVAPKTPRTIFPVFSQGASGPFLPGAPLQHGLRPVSACTSVNGGDWRRRGPAHLPCRAAGQ